jgi:4-amino-4-deoxy-L-arabinose transferase-like glycosyltransferase
MASSRNVVRYATDLLSDFPSAACLLAALAILVDEVDRDDGPRWRILLAAPALAAAMYVRYGSVLPIAVIVLAALIVGARGIRRRPLPVVATAALFLVLLVPHFIEAHSKTGSPLGILLVGREVPQDEYFGEGLVTYVASNPFKLYGLTIPVALVAGLVAVGRAVRDRDRRRLLLWLVAVGSLVAIGLTTHAQVRYILVSLALLAVLGVDELRYWISQLPARTARVATAGALAAVMVAWALLARKHLRADEYRVTRMQGTLAAAAAIRADAAGAPCTVIGNHYTQLEWYSGCRAPLVMSPQSVETAQLRGDRVYIVRDYGPAVGNQPQPELSAFPGGPTSILARPKVVDVARVDRK